MRLIDADALSRDFCPGETYRTGEIQDVIDAATTINGWISVKDRLPNKSGTYLMHAESGDVFSAEYDSCADDDRCFGYWQEYFDGGTLGCVGGEFAPVHGITHWMPLPEPPEEEDDA